MTQPSARPGAEHLYLEDFQVGQRFKSGTHTLDEAEIKAFARQFDPQPFHLDDEAARGTMFGGLAASGWHTAAVTMRLNTEGGLPIMGGIIGAGERSPGPSPHGRGTRCTWRARWWR